MIDSWQSAIGWGLIFEGPSKQCKICTRLCCHSHVSLKLHIQLQEAASCSLLVLLIHS